MLSFTSATNFAHGTSRARRNHCASISSFRDHNTRTMPHHQLPGCPVKGLTSWQNIPKQPAIAPHASSLSSIQRSRLTRCNLCHFQVIVDNGSNSLTLYSQMCIRQYFCLILLFVINSECVCLWMAVPANVTLIQDNGWVLRLQAQTLKHDITGLTSFIITNTALIIII